MNEESLNLCQGYAEGQDKQPPLSLLSTSNFVFLSLLAYSLQGSMLSSVKEWMMVRSLISIVLTRAVTLDLWSQMDWVQYLLSPIFFLLCFINCCYDKEEFDTDRF